MEELARQILQLGADDLGRLFAAVIPELDAEQQAAVSAALGMDDEEEPEQPEEPEETDSGVVNVQASAAPPMEAPRRGYASSGRIGPRG